MLTKRQKYLQRQWIKGRLNIRTAAKRFGYTGSRISNGMRHISELLSQMHIPSLK